MAVYPTSDVSDGGWTDQAGGGSLFAVLDETTRDDADYVKSSINPVIDPFEVALGDPPGLFDTLRFPVGKEFNNSIRIDITVALMQGATEIASWTYPDVAFGF